LNIRLNAQQRVEIHRHLFAPLANHAQNCRFHDLQILQNGAGLFYFIESKEPLNGAIIQANQAGHARSPLRLATHEQLNRLPVIRQHCKVLRILTFRQGHAKRSRILLRVILNAAGCPVLGGLDQFFALAPCRLLK